MSTRTKKMVDPCRPQRKGRSGCPPRSIGRELKSYPAIVRDYLREYQQDADDLLLYYATSPSLSDAVRRAALCELPTGKRHSHQYRIPAASLEEARRRLQRCKFSSCGSFHDLLEFVNAKIRNIHMIGELTVYDIAHRLGAYLDLAPTRIYLHAGVRIGARALGLGSSREWIEESELPKAFWRLRPDQLEDCLCLYKDDLQAIGQNSKRNRR